MKAKTKKIKSPPEFVIKLIGLVYLLFGDKKKKFCMIGHRGYSSKYLENTEQAFLTAVEHGSGGIETDVRITCDNKLILSHGGEAHYRDGTVLEISKSTYDELMAKPLLNKHNGDEVYLCSFERYLEICRDNKLICFIEFKGEFTDELTRAAVDTILRIYDISKCPLQSFNMQNLERAHALYPELPIMLTYGFNERDRGLDYNECIKRGFSIDVDYKTASRKMVRDFHANGLKVGTWTCNNKLTLNYARWLGVDYIESDVY